MALLEHPLDISALAGDSARHAGTIPRRVLVVAGIVTPYTHRLFEEIAGRYRVELHVLACAQAEPGREWRLPEATSYARRVMPGIRWHRSYVSHVYVNPGVVSTIVRLRPDVVVVCDFSPTMLMAAAAARLMGRGAVLSSETLPATDPGQNSIIHRWVRRAFKSLVTSAIGGSAATLEVYARHGIGGARTLVVPMVPAWHQEGSVPVRQDRPYDLLFCGLVDDRWKGALHFLETIRCLAARGRKLRVRVAGDGPLRDRLQRELAALRVEARFDGYVQQSDLADVYRSAKLFLFPSRGDTWGLVANEAAQCGTPVLISPHAQAAFELVERFGCGEVIALDPSRWADAVENHLDDEALWQAASRAGLASREHFSLPIASAAFMKGLSLAQDGRVRINHEHHKHFCPDNARISE